MPNTMTAAEKQDLISGARSSASFLRRRVGGREAELVAADTIDALRDAGTRAKKLEWAPIVGDERSLICQVPELGKSYIIRYEEEEDVYVPIWDAQLPLSKSPEPLQEAAQKDFEGIVGSLVELAPGSLNADPELTEAADRLYNVISRVMADREWRTNDNSLWPDMSDAWDAYDDLRKRVSQHEEPNVFWDGLEKVREAVLEGDQSVLSQMVARKLPTGWRCCTCNLEFLRVFDADNKRVMPADLDDEWGELLELAESFNRFFGLETETVRSHEDRVATVEVRPSKKNVTDADLAAAAEIIMTHPRGLDQIAQAISFRLPYENCYSTARRAVRAMAGKTFEPRTHYEEMSEHVSVSVTLAKKWTVDTLEGELPPGWELIMSIEGGIVVLDEDDHPQHRADLDPKLKKAVEMVDILRHTLGFEELEVKSRRQKPEAVKGLTP